MNFYFPNTFKRTVFPDAGMTTPRQITFKLVRYAKKHPETGLKVFEIPQVPGYRRMSRSNKSVSASLITTGYAIPIAILNPYLAGGIFLDYLVRGRFPRIHEHPTVLAPDELSELSDLTPVSERARPAEVAVKSGSPAASAPAAKSLAGAAPVVPLSASPE
jgi:hypothetical protein